MPCFLNAMGQHTAHDQSVRIAGRMNTALKCVGEQGVQACLGFDFPRGFVALRPKA